MKVLVIRLKYIGDTLLCLPLCRSIKQSRPDSEVHYLVYEASAPLFRVGDGWEPGIDQVQVISNAEKGNPLRYLEKLRQLRWQKYDVVIDTLTVPATVLISRFSGAATTIGFDKGKWRSRCYSVRIPHVPNVSSSKQKLQLLRGVPGGVAPVRDMSLHLSQAETRSARRMFSDQGMDLTRPVVMLSPIARIGSKLWPSDYFVELANTLLRRYPQVQLWIVWGPGERHLASAVADGVESRHRVFSDLRTASVREVAALASLCVLYVGNDSGPRHIAEAAGTATFTIFSPIFSRHVWIPNPGRRHCAIDIADVLSMEFDEHLMNIPYFRQELDRYYRMMTPAAVWDVLNPMLHRLLEVPRDDDVNRSDHDPARGADAESADGSP